MRQQMPSCIHLCLASLGCGWHHGVRLLLLHRPVLLVPLACLLLVVMLPVLRVQHR